MDSKLVNGIKGSIGNWESLGILDGLYKEQKERVSNAYDLLAEYMLKNEEKISNYLVDYMVFPILRKVLCEYPECNFNNPGDFIEYVASYVSYYMPYYEGIKKAHNIDIEAQMCYDCVEQIKAILKAKEDDKV